MENPPIEYGEFRFKLLPSGEVEVMGLKFPHNLKVIPQAGNVLRLGFDPLP